MADDPIAAEFDQQRKRAAEAEELARINARTPGEQLNRDIRATGTGMNDAIGSAIGAVPDLVAAGVRGVERTLIPDLSTPTLSNLVTGQNPDRKYMFAPPPGQFTKWAQGGLNAVGDAIYGPLKPDTPVERGLYAAGHGTGDALSMVVPAAGVSRVAGGVLGGVAGQLAENPITQAIAGAAGGAATQASGSPLVGLGVSMATPFASGVARGVVSPGASQLNPEQARLAGVAAREGIQLSPGQQSGSIPMRTMDAVFKELPLTSGVARADEEAQRVAYNRAVLRRAGETGENYATPNVVNDALDRAGERMTEIYSRNAFDVNAPAMARVQAVLDRAHTDLTDPNQIAQIRNKARDFYNKIQHDGQGGLSVPGPAFASLDSDIARVIRTTNDGQVKYHMGQLRNALHEGMDASLTGEDAANLAEARRHYANGIDIREAINAPSAATAAGHVPAMRLSTVESRGGDYGRGRGDLDDLARIGRAFIQDPIPNSGTPMRTTMKTLLTGGMLGGGAFMGGSDPLHAALLAAGGVALPSFIQAGARSPWGRAYLTNQAAAGWGPQVTLGTMTGIGTAQLPGLLSPAPGPGPRVAPINDERFQPQ